MEQAAVLLDVDADTAWGTHQLFIQRLVTEGRLTPQIAEELGSAQGKAAWLRGYLAERALLERYRAYEPTYRLRHDQHAVERVQHGRVRHTEAATCREQILEVARDLTAEHPTGPSRCGRSLRRCGRGTCRIRRARSMRTWCR